MPLGKTLPQRQCPILHRNYCTTMPRSSGSSPVLVSTVSRLRRSPIWLTTTLDSARTQGVLRQDDVLVDIGVRLTAETACSRIALQTPDLDAQQGDLYGNCGYPGGTLRRNDATGSFSSLPTAETGRASR